MFFPILFQCCVLPAENPVVKQKSGIFVLLLTLITFTFFFSLVYILPLSLLASRNVCFVRYIFYCLLIIWSNTSCVEFLLRSLSLRSQSDTRQKRYQTCLCQFTVHYLWMWWMIKFLFVGKVWLSCLTPVLMLEGVAFYYWMFNSLNVTIHLCLWSASSDPRRHSFFIARNPQIFKRTLWVFFSRWSLGPLDLKPLGNTGIILWSEAHI